MSADLSLRVVVFYVSIHNAFRQACDLFDEFNLTHISLVIQTFYQNPIYISLCCPNKVQAKSLYVLKSAH